MHVIGRLTSIIEHEHQYQKITNSKIGRYVMKSRDSKRLVTTAITSKIF